MSAPAFGSFEFVLRAAGFPPLAETQLRWSWDDDYERNEGDDDAQCEAPQCERAFWPHEPIPLVHRGGDFLVYACSRACAAAIEHRAKVRSERARPRRMATNPRVAAEARSFEAVARACRVVTGRATGADRHALWLFDGDAREIALRCARLAQVDRDLAVYGCSPKGALDRVQP